MAPVARKAKAAALLDLEPINEELSPDLAALIVSIPIERWSIDDVLIDPNNARIHDRKSIDGIKGSIAKFGQVEPLLLRKATKVLIAGEGRLIAMQELGHEHVEVRPLPVDATTAVALSLALNRTAELSHFDFESVAAQINGLKEDGFSVDALGWTDYELGPLLAATWEPPSVGKGAKGSGSAADEGNPHTVMFSAGQWRVLVQAIEKIRVKESDPLITQARAIELVVADWLSGE
jgi:hypothetical protein